MNINYYLKKYLKHILFFLLNALLILQISCAINPKKTFTGMLGGAAVGAIVGNQFADHGDAEQYENRNTIITAVLGGLLVAGVLQWHYQEMQDAKVELSGKYARYRLCDPDEFDPEFTKSMQSTQISEGKIYGIKENQIGKLAISLDDNTKWIYPVFRKRYLMPELQEDTVISKRYIWEIIKPGKFVTRSQNPGFFAQQEDESIDNDQDSEEKKKEDQNKKEENDKPSSKINNSSKSYKLSYASSLRCS